VAALWNKSGEWLLVIATGISLTLLWLASATRPRISRLAPIESLAMK
jgi:hypothetical protein